MVTPFFQFSIHENGNFYQKQDAIVANNWKPTKRFFMMFMGAQKLRRAKVKLGMNQNRTRQRSIFSYCKPKYLNF